MTRRHLIVVLASGVLLVLGSALLVRVAYPWARWHEDFFPGRPPELTLEPRAWTVSDDSITFAAVGDTGSGGRNAMDVARQLAIAYEDRPFGTVLHAGDVSYYGSIADRWEQVFVAPFGPLLEAGVEFHIAVGNHEYEEQASAAANAEIAALLERTATTGRYYSVRRGPAEFFVLDSSTPLVVGTGADEQLRWLESALQRSTAPWKIAVLHHPPYSSGPRGSWLQVREALEPILIRGGVQLVIAGHDHFYERTHPQKGVVYVISGGGCKRSPVQPSEFSAVALETLQFMVFQIDGSTLTGRAVDQTGKVVDRFVIQEDRS